MPEDTVIAERVYIGSYEFEDSVLSRVKTPTGYWDASGTYHLMVTDFQGNTATVIRLGATAVQTNSYYPYGLPVSTSTGAGANRYRFGRKELETVSGVNLYDFEARAYSPAEGLFWSPDPLYGDADGAPHGIAPRAYCAANPLRFTDPSGLDCVVLNLGDGFNQHLAMLIQNENGKWQYYSINGENMYSSGSFTGGRENNDVAEGSWDSVEDFLSSDYFNNRNADGTKVDEDDRQENKKVIKYEFTEACLIHSTPEQDAVMRNEFNSIANAHDYKLMTNNCAHAVQKTLFKAGLMGAESGNNVGNIEPSFHVFPSVAFKAIRIHNSGGKYYRKESSLWRSYPNVFKKRKI